MSKFFKITKNTVKPKQDEYAWLGEEQYEDLHDAGFSTESLGTGDVYLVDEDGRVFAPVGRDYTDGWKYQGEHVYVNEDNEWVDWEDLPRAIQLRLIGRKRWIPEGEPVPEPRRDR